MSDVPFLIAVDPSFTATGVSVFKGLQLVDSVAIRTSNTKTPSERLDFIVRAFLAFMEQYPARLMAIETQFIALRSMSVLRVVEVKGAIEGAFLALCLARGLHPTLIEVTPSQARKRLNIRTKMKRAEGKMAIKEKVLALYPELATDRKQDIYDSVGVGLAGYDLYKEQLGLSTANKD